MSITTFHILTLLQGTYISWTSGEMVRGDKEVERSYTLSEMPVFVKAGSIIPMRTDDFGMKQCLVYDVSIH